MRLNAEANDLLTKLSLDKPKEPTGPSEEVLAHKLESAEQQEAMLKKELEVLQNKLKLDTTYEGLKKIEREIEEKIECNKAFERDMKSMNKAIKQNEGELLRKDNQVDDIKSEMLEGNLEKQLAKEIEKETILMKKMKGEQEAAEKKQELQSKAEVSLQSLQFELKALEEAYKSKYNVNMMLGNTSLNELRNELTQLKGILICEQKKNALTINNLIRDIEAARDVLRTKGYVSIRLI
jgi:hypothetical protein